jgi:hypothetical protein
LPETQERQAFEFVLQLLQFVTLEHARQEVDEANKKLVLHVLQVAPSVLHSAQLEIGVEHAVHEVGGLAR